MLRRLEDTAGQPVRISIDGQMVEAQAGDSVAAALLFAGFTRTRTTLVSGASRAPYCMMGVCFECLTTINGIANRQACTVEVEEGMEIRTQIAADAERAVR